MIGNTTPMSSHSMVAFITATGALCIWIGAYAFSNWILFILSQKCKTMWPKIDRMRSQEINSALIRMLSHARCKGATPNLQIGLFELTKYSARWKGLFGADKKSYVWFWKTSTDDSGRYACVHRKTRCVPLSVAIIRAQCACCKLCLCCCACACAAALWLDYPMIIPSILRSGNLPCQKRKYMFQLIPVMMQQSLSSVNNLFSFVTIIKQCYNMKYRI